MGTGDPDVVLLLLVLALLGHALRARIARPRLGDGPRSDAGDGGAPCRTSVRARRHALDRQVDYRRGDSRACRRSRLGPAGVARRTRARDRRRQ